MPKPKNTTARIIVPIVGILLMVLVGWAFYQNNNTPIPPAANAAANTPGVTTTTTPAAGTPEKSAEASHFHIFHRREANEPTSERGRWLIDEFIAHGLLTPAQRAEAAAALRDCWTSSALPLPEAPAAAPKPATKPKKRSTLAHA